MPVYWPLGSTSPITLLVRSAALASGVSPTPSGTRTTTMMGRHCWLMASSAVAKVPSVPALPSAVNTLVTSTGLS